MNDWHMFRGKRHDADIWDYGYLTLGRTWRRDIEEVLTPHIETRHENPTRLLLNEIDPATIGQCTGLKDRHGKLIFDGDLCKGEYREIEVDKDGKPYEGDNVCTYIEVVRYCVDQGGYMLTTGNDGEMSVLDINAAARVEVVGNVHDNADLLEVQS